MTECGAVKILTTQYWQGLAIVLGYGIEGL